MRMPSIKNKASNGKAVMNAGDTAQTPKTQSTSINSVSLSQNEVDQFMKAEIVSYEGLYGTTRVDNVVSVA